ARSTLDRGADREAGPAARQESFLRGDLLDQVLGERQADAAVGIVEAALRQRQRAAAGAVLGVQRLQRLVAPFARQAGEIDARDLVGLRRVGETDAVFILGVDDLDLRGEPGQ